LLILDLYRRTGGRTFSRPLSSYIRSSAEPPIIDVTSGLGDFLLR
jgi:hypothetical protein